METKFNFNSSPCTSKEQSERLLALGLKKETTDMALVPLMEWDDCTAQEYFTGKYTAREKEDAERYGLDYIPAWSLHGLILLLDTIACDWIFRNGDCYTNAINGIEWLIKEGYFPKEYLV